MKRIFKGDSIFQSPGFLKSEVQYNLIHRIADDPDAELYASDNHQAIFARTSLRFPAWVWIDDDAEQSVWEEVSETVKERCLGKGDFEMVSSWEFIESFARTNHLSKERVLDMESYVCRQINPETPLSGVMARPTMLDSDRIAAFFAGFMLDGFGKEVTAESQLGSAERLIQSGHLYTLVAENQIVSIANIAHRSERHARINTVFTPPSMRGQGYATSLVAKLTSLVLEEDRDAVLFTDQTNQTSNSIYQRIGYQSCGKVYHYRLS